MFPCRRAFLTALLTTGMASGTMTAVWKVSPQLFRDSHGHLAKAVKCPRPANAPDPLIRSADELLDLRPVLDGTRHEFATPPGAEPSPAPVIFTGLKWSGDWVVFDATAGVVAARGTRNEILSAERLLGLDDPQTLLSRTRLEFVSAEHPGFQTTFHLNSDKTITTEITGWSVYLTTKRTPATESTVLDLTLAFPAPEGDGHWHLSAEPFLRDAERTLIARHDDWELWATTEMVDADGILFHSQRSLFTTSDSDPRPWPHGVQDTTLLTEVLDSDRCLWWKSRNNPPLLETKEPPARSRHDDDPPPPPPPTAALIPQEDLERIATQPLIQPPAEYHAQLRGSFYDLHPWLAEKGLALDAPGSFAGYDPLANEIVILGPVTAKEAIERILQPAYRVPQNLRVELEGPIPWGLLTSSDQFGDLTQHRLPVHDDYKEDDEDEEKDRPRKLEIYRHHDEGPAGTIALSYEVREIISPGHEAWVKSAGAFFPDRPVEILSAQAPDHAEIKLDLRTRLEPGAR